MTRSVTLLAGVLTTWATVGRPTRRRLGIRALAGRAMISEQDKRGLAAGMLHGTAAWLWTPEPSA